MSDEETQLAIRTKDELDVSKIFLTYLAACGDIEKTAVAADCTISEVVYLAKTEQWDLKMQQQALRPAKDFKSAQQQAREVNRMACYVQALRLRGLIDETIHHLYENGTESLEHFCTEKKRDGSTFFTTKPLLELVKSAEAAHALLYRALGDVVAAKDSPADAFKNLSSLHMTVVQQLSNAESARAAEPVLKAAERVTAAPSEVFGYLDADTTPDSPPQD